jgi:hypothetical protein
MDPFRFPPNAGFVMLTKKTSGVQTGYWCGDPNNTCYLYQILRKLRMTSTAFGGETWKCPSADSLFADAVRAFRLGQLP